MGLIYLTPSSHVIVKFLCVRGRPMKKQIPEELNRVVDKVLAYRPKPKSKAAKKRAEQTKAIAMKRAAD